MWKSSKGSVDVLDLPDLHRRKLISLPEREKSEMSESLTKDGFFDLSNQKNLEFGFLDARSVSHSKECGFQTLRHNQTNSTLTNETQPQIENQTPNQVTDFLSDFASIGASNPSPQQIENPRNNNEESLKDLKWRIENIEFKLEQLMEKLNSQNK